MWFKPCKRLRCIPIYHTSHLRMWHDRIVKGGDWKRTQYDGGSNQQTGRVGANNITNGSAQALYQNSDDCDNRV